MLQVQSRMIVCDNTGARIAQLIKIPGASKPHYARIGQIVKVTIKESTPEAQVKKGTMSLAVIVRCVQPISRANGMRVKFDDNACVLIKEDKNPKGTRVFGPIAREVKEKGFNKIASLAFEVL
jgi:large subunit ribosomal protein L14